MTHSGQFTDNLVTCQPQIGHRSGKDGRPNSDVLLNTNAQHCLVPLLPPECNLETRSTLRARGHRFSLPQCKSKLFKDAYLNRLLILYF